MKRYPVKIFLSVIVFVAGVVAVNAMSIGQVISNIKIKDSDNRPAEIPDLGSKALTIVYSDSDASDISDPISDALKAKNYPETKQRGIGIANLKDSPAPNWIIRKIIKAKIAKYKAVILADDDLTVPRVWQLGDCNNKSVFIVIGADIKVKYIKYFDKNHKPAQSDIDTVVNLVNGLVK